MMRVFFILAISVSLLTAPMLINEAMPSNNSTSPRIAKAKKNSAPQGKTLAQQKKDTLVSSINAMRNQELRVAVLQQLLNQEVARLRQIQAVFCDQYELNLDKFRKGGYTYDQEKGEFVEKKASK